ASGTFGTGAGPTERATCRYCAVRNPDSSTVTAYVPGTSASARYRPCSSVVRTRLRAVPTSVTVTVAPGRAAFDASVTKPAIDPVVPCAAATTGVVHRIARA